MRRVRSHCSPLGGNDLRMATCSDGRAGGLTCRAPGRVGTGWEAVLILHREGKKRWNGGGHHAVWTINKVEAKYHPTQKPLPLLKKWIMQFTDPGDLICDPFMGSATTGVAALQLGRRFIGNELDAKHFATAQKRIQEVAMQPQLFTEVVG
jgi:DNA modification methylase